MPSDSTKSLKYSVPSLRMLLYLASSPHLGFQFSCSQADKISILLSGLAKSPQKSLKSGRLTSRLKIFSSEIITSSFSFTRTASTTETSERFWTKKWR